MQTKFTTTLNIMTENISHIKSLLKHLDFLLISYWRQGQTLPHLANVLKSKIVNKR